MAVLLIRRKQRQKTDIDNRETNGQFHLTQLVTAVINCTSATWINLLNSSGYILHNHHLYKSVIPAATSYMATMEVYLIPVATLWVITICRSLYDSSGNTLHAHILWNSTWFQWPEFTWSLFVEVYMIPVDTLYMITDCGSLHDSSRHIVHDRCLWKSTWYQWPHYMMIVEVYMTPAATLYLLTVCERLPDSSDILFSKPPPSTAGSTKLDE